MNRATPGCGICGWPGANGGACPACGAPAGAAAPDAEAGEGERALARPPVDEPPALKKASAAWQRRDREGLVGQCLAALDVRAPAVTSGEDGQAWAFKLGEAAIFVLLDPDTDEIHIESPVARLPAAERVPMMRALLEMNAGAVGPCRFCLRGDRVVLRYAQRTDWLSPPRLVAALREVAAHARSKEEMLALGFAARGLGEEALQSRRDTAVLGKALRLATLRGAVPPAAPPPEITVPTEPIAVDPSLADDDEVLVVPDEEALGAPDDEVLVVPEVPDAPPLAAMRAAPPPRPGLSARAVYRAERADAAPRSHAQPLARVPLPAPPPSSARARRAEAVCQILRHSLDLARPLPSQNVHPSIEWLLVRATIFRAYDEDPVGAAALLGRAFAPVMEVTWEALGAKIDPTHGSIESELALSTLDPAAMHAMFKEIIAKNAHVGEQPSWTPAGAKSMAAVNALVSRWLGGIELAPDDIPLRHFLLLGAYAEVLVRAKFAPWLETKLRAAEAEGRRAAVSDKNNRRLVRALKGLRA